MIHQCSTLPHPWDDFDAYLFDIDGTLLECKDATHYFAFRDALRTISGRDLTLEGVVAHGNTDAGILRDALSLAGIPESQWRPKLTDICDSLCEFVQMRKTELRPTVFPRVQQILEHLRARGALLGVATGNLRGIGQLKLEHAGLWKFFDFSAFSDGCENRTEVFRNGIEAAIARRGSGGSICVVGDTPADIKAAKANGLPVIAVATGIFSIEELGMDAPDLCVRSLDELLTTA
jgi:phosphoglycolate phosphatase